MRKILVIATVILLHVNLFGQRNYIPYYNITAEAEWHYDNGRFDQAEVLFVQAFKQIDLPKTKDVWLYAIILSKKGEKNKVYRLLKTHIRKIGGVSRRIDPYLKDSKIELSDKQIAKINSFLIDTTSIEYLDEMKTISSLDSMGQADQLCRKKDAGYDSIWWVSGNDSVFVERKNIIQEVDSLNYLTIVDLIENGKLKNNRFLGSNFSLLLIHMRTDRFVNIEPQLFELVQTGILDPWDFASAKDCAYTASGDCIIYFAHTYLAHDLTCISYDEILKNRKSIGLSTYYRRPSFNFYIRPGRMMKTPMREFYESELKRKQ